MGDMWSRKPRDEVVEQVSPALHCAAQGCPNTWTADIGNGRLCSWHHWRSPHLWPQITADLQDEVRRRARAVAQRRVGTGHDIDGPSVYSREERLAMLAHLREGLAGMGKQPPKACAYALRAREAAGERLTLAQRGAWREALWSELRAEENQEREP